MFRKCGLIWDVQISFTTFLVQHFHVRNLNGGTLLKIFLATSRLLDHYHFHLLNFSDATLLHSQLCLCNTFTFTILLFVLLVWQILCLICNMWITFYHHGRWPYRRGTSCQGRSNPWKIARYHFIQQKLGVTVEHSIVVLRSKLKEFPLGEGTWATRLYWCMMSG